MDRIRAAIAEMTKVEESLLATRMDAADHNARLARAVIVYGIGASVLVLLLAGWLITRDIASSLRAMTEAARRITAGHLEEEVPGHERSDEIGQLAQSFQVLLITLRRIARLAEHIARGDLTVDVSGTDESPLLAAALQQMLETLRRMTRQLREGADTLGLAANDIMAATAELVAGANETAASVSETTTTVEEVRQTAKLASQKARDVMDSARHAVDTAQQGRDAVARSVVAMEEIGRASCRERV